MKTALLVIALNPLTSFAAKTYESHAYLKWTTQHGVGSAVSCDRWQLLDIKDVAAQDALDACANAGHRLCESNRAVVLYNGSLMNERASKIIGAPWPPNALSGYFYGCIARGRAVGHD